MRFEGNEERGRIIQNAIYVPSLKLFLKSSHRHDYVVVDIPGDKQVGVDGGNVYFRSIGDPADFVDYYLTTANTLEQIADKLLWGTYGADLLGGVFGVDGKMKPNYVLLKDCDTDHLKAILKHPAELAERAIEKAAKVQSVEDLSVAVVEHLDSFDFIGHMHNFVIKWILQQRAIDKDWPDRINDDEDNS